MRYRAQHLLPKHLNRSKRKYGTRVIDYSADFQTRVYIPDRGFDTIVQTNDIISLKYSTLGDHLFVLGGDNNTLFEYALCPYLDVSSAVFDTSLVVSAQAVGFVFNTDGDTLGIATSTGYVYEYTLGTPWNLSTATLTKTISITPATDIVDVTINGGGEYITTTADGIIYNVSSPIRTNPYKVISNWSFNSKISTTLSFGSTLVFRQDGYTMYISTGADIIQYSLTSPFDPSTATYVSNFGFEYWYFWISIDGEHLVITDAGNVRYYKLDPPYLLSSAVFQHERILSVGDSEICFNPDGTRAYYHRSATNNTLAVRDLLIPYDFDSVIFGSGSDYPMDSSTNDRGSLIITNDGSHIYFHNEQFTIQQWTLDTPFGDVLTKDGTTDLTVANFYSYDSGSTITDDGSGFIITDKTNGNFFSYDIGTKEDNQEADLNEGVVPPVTLVSGYYIESGTQFLGTDSTGVTKIYHLSTPYVLESKTSTSEYVDPDSPEAMTSYQKYQKELNINYFNSRALEQELQGWLITAQDNLIKTYQMGKI